MTIRVAFVEQDSQLGGVEVNTLETVSAIDSHLYHSTVICPEEGDLTKQLDDLRLPFIILPRPRLLSVSIKVLDKYLPNPFAILWNVCAILQTAFRLKKLIKHQFDLVVTKGLLAHFYGGMASRGAGIPCVWHVQEVVNSSDIGGLYHKILNWAAQHWSDRIIVDAESVAQQFDPALHKLKKVSVIYNAVDLNKFSPIGERAELNISSKNGKEPVLIGQVGRIVPIKGQHVLLEAFIRVVDQWPNTHLFFAGIPLFDRDHYLQHLQSMVPKHDLSDQVHFLGFYHELPKFLRAIDIFVHPSTEADSPISVQEAMAVEKAIIASDVPGMNELFAEKEEGLFVPPGDPEILAEKILYLIANPIKRETLGKMARKAAEDRFSKAKYASAINRALSQVSGHR